jgi:hypothetical protein
VNTTITDIINTEPVLVIEYVDRQEAMRILGCSRTTLATLVKKHKLPVCRLTRRPLYRKTDIIDLIEAHMSDHKKKALGAAS